MKILVTGAAGLIGSHLIDLLVEDNQHEVYGIDDMSFGNRLNLANSLKQRVFTFINGKVQAIPTFTSKFDVIYHLASMKKPHNNAIKSSFVMDENHSMIQTVVNESIKFGSHLIFTSTSDVYGNSKTFLEDEPITIGPPSNERYSYALSKLHSEQYIYNHISQSNLSATIVRVFGCASWRSNKSWSGGHLPLFVHNALLNKNITIHGDGTQTRSICHAIDIAKGLYDMLYNLDNVKSEIINIGTSQQTSIKEVAEYIISKTKSRSNIIYEPRTSIFGDYKEVLIRFANTDKAKKLLDFQVGYDTFDVIDEMICKFNDENSGYYSY